MSTLPAAITQPTLSAPRSHTAVVAIAASTATTLVILSLTSIQPRGLSNHVSGEGRSISPASLTAPENNGPRGKTRTADANATGNAMAVATDTPTAGSNRNRGTSLRRQR